MPLLLFNAFFTNNQTHGYSTRTANNYRTHCRTNLKKFTILCQDPKIWNYLPVHITSLSSFPNFKKQHQTNFFAMSSVFNVSIMDLQQCSRRQLFRKFFFIVFVVLLRYVFGLRRAEYVPFKVVDATGYVKYNFNNLWTSPKSVLMTSFVENLANSSYMCNLTYFINGH